MNEVKLLTCTDRLKNRRVKVGWHPVNNDWMMIFTRLPTPEEKAAGKRKVDTVVKLSDEAMGSLVGLVFAILKESERQGLRDDFVEAGK